MLLRPAGSTTSGTAAREELASCSEGPGGGQLRCSADGTTLCHSPSPVADPVTLCKLDAENVDDQRHCDPPEQ